MTDQELMDAEAAAKALMRDAAEVTALRNALKAAEARADAIRAKGVEIVTRVHRRLWEAKRKHRDAEARADAAWRAALEAASRALYDAPELAKVDTRLIDPVHARIRALPPPSATAAPEVEKCPECGVLNGLHDVRGCSLAGRAPSRGEVG